MSSVHINNAKTVTIDCGDCPIQRHAICSRCDGDELHVLEQMKTYRRYAKGEVITYMGEPMRHVGSLVSGVASISQALEDGRRQIMGVLLPSDFIGRPGRRQAQYDITAASEVVICRFEITAFENMLRVSPSLGPRLLEMTMDELDAVRDWMLLLGRKSAREKVATLIYHFAAKNRLLSGELDHQSWHFMLPLTREALADYLGLTIETVSRQMSALKKAGVIALQGQRVIVIPDFRLLQAETGDECNNDQLP